MPNSDLSQILEALDAQQKRNMEEMRELFDSAFPEGDPKGHRAYHEEQLALLKERTAFWREIRQKTLVALLWAALLALGTATLDYLKAHLK